jgi:hypothetical protein
VEQRLCVKCNETKPFGDGIFFRNNRNTCRDCERKQSAARTYKLTRGISYEERDALLYSQGGKCGCCGSTTHGSKKGWHVDHCHDTGVIRAVLCANCNIALGHVNDSVEHLEMLISYLWKHKAEGATTILKE